MLVSLIVAAEIAFWLVLAAGLAARYVLRRERLSTALLLAVPLVDLVVLVGAAVDLRAGGTAQWNHGLAAAYIGFSVAFGPGVIRWADVRFAHRIAGGPAPVPGPRLGLERARREWREFGKAALAWAIASGVLVAGIVLVDDPARTAALVAWIGQLTLVLGVWALIALSYTVFPKRPPAGDRGRGSTGA